MEDMQTQAVREALRKLTARCKGCPRELSQQELFLYNGFCTTCRAYRTVMRKRWPTRW
jgi:hypothetical protein